MKSRRSQKEVAADHAARARQRELVRLDDRREWLRDQIRIAVAQLEGPHAGPVISPDSYLLGCLAAVANFDDDEWTALRERAWQRFWSARFESAKAMR